MRRLSQLLLAGVLWGAGLIVGGCATVPKEAIVLSHTMGQDLQEVHRSHLALIRVHFGDLRERVNTFIDTRWKPSYLRDFIKSGDLVGLATKPDPNDVLTGVGAWVDVAMEEIETKRQGLLKPIDAQEDTLVEIVEDAFNRLTRANAAITAHLNSLQKIQEVQDETLQALKLKDLRDRVNQGLVAASESAQDALNALEKDTKTIDKAGELKTKLQHRKRGGSGND
jgi:hypothetical protein